MVHFHDVRLPTNIALGASGGPERRTEIVTLGSGFEERNSPWAHSRRRYNAGYGLRSLSDVHSLIAFFEARRGRLYGFRWKDFADHQSVAPGLSPGAEDQPLGTGDGVQTRFVLTKSYHSGGESYVRPIKKPVAGTVRTAIDGAEQAAGADFTVDAATGELVFAVPPEAGTAVTAGFAFDVPVRFDTDSLTINLSAFAAGEVPDVPIVEILL